MTDDKAALLPCHECNGIGLIGPKPGARYVCHLCDGEGKFRDRRALLPAQRGDNDMTRDDGLRDPRYKGRAAQRGEGDDVERVARAIFEDAHKGLKNCWQWDDSGLDDEHPGERDRFLRYARAAIAALPRKEGWVSVPRAALRWLFGEEGEFECPPDRYFRGKPPAFWWRSVFREMIAAPAAGAEQEPWEESIGATQP